MTGDRAISTIFTRGINDFELPLTLQMWAERGLTACFLLQHNTFQLVISTDGTHSFAIFNYGDIMWTYGAASNNIPAQVKPIYHKISILL